MFSATLCKGEAAGWMNLFFPNRLNSVASRQDCRPSVVSQKTLSWQNCCKLLIIRWLTWVA